MTPDEAAATGAHRHEVDPSELREEPVAAASHRVKHRATVEADLQVPGGATDPLWYLAAAHLAPHMESTRKRGWIEGFVAALETLRGVNAALPDVAEVLLETISLETSIPEL